MFPYGLDCRESFKGLQSNQPRKGSSRRRRYRPGWRSRTVTLGSFQVEGARKSIRGRQRICWWISEFRWVRAWCGWGPEGERFACSLFTLKRSSPSFDLWTCTAASVPNAPDSLSEKNASVVLQLGATSVVAIVCRTRSSSLSGSPQGKKNPDRDLLCPGG